MRRLDSGRIVLGNVNIYMRVAAVDVGPIWSTMKFQTSELLGDARSVTLVVYQLVDVDDLNKSNYILHVKKWHIGHKHTSLLYIDCNQRLTSSRDWNVSMTYHNPWSFPVSDKGRKVSG